MKDLSYLHLGANQLMGKILASLGNISKLSFLVLGYNQLSAPVPPTLGNNVALNVLHLGFNNLEGNLDFLPDLSRCRQLQILIIGKNNIIGVLPSHVGNLSSQLFTFILGYNKLIGGLPISISNMSSLLDEVEDTDKAILGSPSAASNCALIVPRSRHDMGSGSGTTWPALAQMNCNSWSLLMRVIL
jgi:hypothetical protein